MKRSLLLMAFIVSLPACAQLPTIYPDLTSSALLTESDCSHLFPQGRWQLHHVIEVTAPGGQKNTFTGVTILSSPERSIQWALMTLEGFVLFSGRYDDTLTVDRAIPPFDRPGFAQGLIDDLMLMFFAPQAPLAMTGRLETGGFVCRYGSTEEKTDIVIKDDRTWSAMRYSTAQRLSRSIVADEIMPVGNTPFAKHLTLKKHSVIGYELNLNLVEAIPLDH